MSPLAGFVTVWYEYGGAVGPVGGGSGIVPSHWYVVSGIKSPGSVGLPPRIGLMFVAHLTQAHLTTLPEGSKGVGWVVLSAL